VNLRGKLLRYGAVSAISSTLSLTILGVLVATGATTSGWANVIATGVGTIPSFELNRRWVWGKKGRRSAWAEVAPYCALAFSGLALSTLAVSVATSWATAPGVRALVAEAASIATFGTLWVVQFVLADRVLFKAAPTLALETGP
jgi:putative flippase GtrA